MTTAVVGNDVVDLRDPRTYGKPDNARFVERVLADGERAVLTRAVDRAAELWAFWAAKEAAYKVVSKLRGSPPVFAHASFSVTWLDAGPDRRRGSVAYEQLEIPVAVTLRGSMIHAVATSGAAAAEPLLGTERLDAPHAEWGTSLEALLPRFTPREADAVHSLPSAAVRLSARKALADLLAVDESALEIVCDPGVTGRRPPRVFLNGRPAPADVSLSHHGSWIAWAALLQKAVGR